MIEGMGTKKEEKVVVNDNGMVGKVRDEIMALLRGLFKSGEERKIAKDGIEIESIDSIREKVEMSSNFDEIGKKEISEDKGLDKAVDILKGKL
jgi:hypothetical protein